MKLYIFPGFARLAWPVRFLWPVKDRSLTAVTRSHGQVAQQDSCFKMSYVEAKSINFWLRYDPKQYITSCFHTYTQTWGDILHILGHISAKCWWILLKYEWFESFFKPWSWPRSGFWNRFQFGNRVTGQDRDRDHCKPCIFLSVQWSCQIGTLKRKLRCETGPRARSSCRCGGRRRRWPRRRCPRGGPGGNCVKIGLLGKSILGDYFQGNRTSQRPFLLLRISFPGRPIFIHFIPGTPRARSRPPLRVPPGEGGSVPAIATRISIKDADRVGEDTFEMYLRYRYTDTWGVVSLDTSDTDTINKNAWKWG